MLKRLSSANFPDARGSFIRCPHSGGTQQRQAIYHLPFIAGLVEKFSNFQVPSLTLLGATFLNGSSISEIVLMLLRAHSAASWRIVSVHELGTDSDSADSKSANWHHLIILAVWIKVLRFSCSLPVWLDRWLAGDQNEKMSQWKGLRSKCSIIFEKSLFLWKISKRSCEPQLLVLIASR